MGISPVAAVLVGFVAETIDGALGMAYGLLSSTVLLASGFPPAVASACVHMAEIVTSAVSGLSHRRFGNVDLGLARRLILPGIVGGVIGAYVLVSIPTAYLRVPVAAYLVVTGFTIIIRSAAGRDEADRSGQACRYASGGRFGRARSPAGPLLGFAGGLCDAMGGGGWGQVVTSSLLARGVKPRLGVGTSTYAEFFVAAAESAAFILTVGIQNWKVVAGLMAGGAVAAPLAAWSTSRLPRRAISIAVGAMVVLTSLQTMWRSLPEWLRLFG